MYNFLENLLLHKARKPIFVMKCYNYWKGYNKITLNLLLVIIIMPYIYLGLYNKQRTFTHFLFLKKGIIRTGTYSNLK